MKSFPGRSPTFFPERRKTVCLDFDGTIFSENTLDSDFVASISKKYEHIIITSNNSSISHSKITRLFSKYRNVTVFTPQILARYIIQETTAHVMTCTSFSVMPFLYSSDQDSSIDARLLTLVKNSKSVNQLVQDTANKHIIIFGKVNPKALESALADSKSKDLSIIAMNLDKGCQSTGMKEDARLLGDLLEAQVTLNKTSKVYTLLLKDYLAYNQCEVKLVIGDNLYEDALLASILGTSFEPKTFNKSTIAN